MGEHRAQTVMRTAPPNATWGLGVTFYAKLQRLIEDVLVAVGGANHGHHTCALRDNSVAEDDVAVAPLRPARSMSN
jgi:hypothetical protein